MITHFEHAYEIGDIVYHAIEENKKGIVVDISYSVKNRDVKYRVVFGAQDSDDSWCESIELANSPNFN